jgi:hypothetical protein
MKDSTLAMLTPLTPKADRSDPEVRLFEEAILRLRGRWPTTATALCLEVNRLFGFGLGGKEAREKLIESRVDETMRLVEALCGPDTAAEVRRSALRATHPAAA